MVANTSLLWCAVFFVALLKNYKIIQLFYLRFNKIITVISIDTRENYYILENNVTTNCCLLLSYSTMNKIKLVWIKKLKEFRHVKLSKIFFLLIFRVFTYLKKAARWQNLVGSQQKVRVRSEKIHQPIHQFAVVDPKLTLSINHIRKTNYLKYIATYW